jgi:hypothetical protein
MEFGTADARGCTGMHSDKSMNESKSLISFATMVSGSPIRGGLRLTPVKKLSGDQVNFKLDLH